MEENGRWLPPYLMTYLPPTGDERRDGLPAVSASAAAAGAVTTYPYSVVDVGGGGVASGW